MTIGQALKSVREKRHFDIEEVAAFTHISPSRLREFEEGDREPSFNQLEKLAEVYGVASYLFAAKLLPNVPETLPDFRRANPGPARLTPAGIRKVWATEKIAR